MSDKTMTASGGCFFAGGLGQATTQAIVSIGEPTVLQILRVLPGLITSLGGLIVILHTAGLLNRRRNDDDDERRRTAALADEERWKEREPR